MANAQLLAYSTLLIYYHLLDTHSNCIYFFSFSQEQKISRGFWGGGGQEKKTTSSFLSIKKPNKFMSWCFPTQASKEAEDTKRARETRERGGGDQFRANTGSCIVILYGKLLWHPPQQTWVIHSKLRDQNNKRNCAWTSLRLSIQASHGRREMIRRDERKRSQHTRKERQVSRCSFIISDSAPPARFQTSFPATSRPSAPPRRSVLRDRKCC